MGFGCYGGEAVLNSRCSQIWVFGTDGCRREKNPTAATLEPHAPVLRRLAPEDTQRRGCRDKQGRTRCDAMRDTQGLLRPGPARGEGCCTAASSTAPAPAREELKPKPARRRGGPVGEEPGALPRRRVLDAGGAPAGERRHVPFKRKYNLQCAARRPIVSISFTIEKTLLAVLYPTNPI